MSAAESLERLGWVVLHATWIGALAAAVLHLALTLLGRAAAHTRHLVACVALGAVVVAVAAVAVAAFVPDLGARSSGALPWPAASVSAPIEGAPASEAGIAGARVDVARADGAPAIAGMLVAVRWALDAAAHGHARPHEQHAHDSHVAENRLRSRLTRRLLRSLGIEARALTCG